MDNKAKGDAAVEVEPKDVWWCETCKTKEELSRDEMMEHLRSEHGLDTKNLTGTRSMVMHMDGDTWFSYVWSWKFETEKGEVFLRNETLQPRAMDDMMRYT